MEVPYIHTPKVPKLKKREPSVHIDDLVFSDWPVPDFKDPRERPEPNREFASMVKGLPLGRMALFANDFELVSGSEDPSALFVEDDEFRIGRESSRQGVYFGRLSLSTTVDPTTVEFVALKPYDRRRARFDMSPEYALTHEYAANEYLKRLSSGTAYDSIGVWRRPPDTFFLPTLMTRFMESSTSLDNIFKGKEKPTKEYVLRAFALGSFGLGLAHGAQIIHGDAFPQNFAINGMRVLFNDTTSLRPYETRKDGEIDERKTAGKISTDIKDFTEGAFHPGVSVGVTRDISRSVLTMGLHVAELYRGYVIGAKLGAKRSGLTPSSIIVSEEEHSKIIQKVVDNYDQGIYSPELMH